MTDKLSTEAHRIRELEEEIRGLNELIQLLKMENNTLKFGQRSQQLGQLSSYPELYSYKERAEDQLSNL